MASLWSRLFNRDEEPEPEPEPSYEFMFANMHFAIPFSQIEDIEERPHRSGGTFCVVKTDHGTYTGIIPADDNWDMEM